MRSPRPTASDRRMSGLQAWSADIVSFRESVGFDLTEPVGFSEYLLAVYGRGAPEQAMELFDTTRAGQRYGFDGAAYRQIFETWATAMAPGGLACMRGLHSIGFLPGDNIPQIIFGHADRAERHDNYSMNFAYCVSHFATGSVERYYPSVTDLWARSAAVIDPAAAATVGVQVRGKPDAWMDARLRQEGRPPRIYWSKLPKKTRDAILVSQTPVVIVVRTDSSDMVGWGGDSESGDTLEAEIHMKRCEPRCIERFFVASAMHKLGKVVRADERRHFALDEHMVVKGKAVYGEPVSLVLHPDAPAKGRMVRNLPDEWKWYEVEVNP